MQQYSFESTPFSVVSLQMYIAGSYVVLLTSGVKLKVAPYSFTIARALITKVQVNCTRSKENISVLRFL